MTSWPNAKKIVAERETWMNLTPSMLRDRARKELDRYRRIPQTLCLRYLLVARAQNRLLVAPAILHEVAVNGRGQLPHIGPGQERGDTATHPGIQDLPPHGKPCVLGPATGLTKETPDGDVKSPALFTVVEQGMSRVKANAEIEVAVAAWTKVGL